MRLTFNYPLDTLELALWDARSGRRLYRSGDDNTWAPQLHRPVAFLAGGRYLACGEMKLRLHPPSGQLQPVLSTWIKKRQHSLAYSSEGSVRAITACYEKEDNILDIWDVSRAQIRCHWANNMRVRLAFSRNGKWIATGAGDTLHLWTLP